MRQVVRDTGLFSSKVVELSVPDTIEVEPEIDGSLIARESCAVYMQKCRQCDRLIQLLVPLYMSPERIGMEHNEDRHRVVIVASI